MLAKHDSGWIAVSRDMRDHPIVGFGQPVKAANPDRGGAYSRAEAWLDLIMTAAWQQKKVCNKGRTILLKRGELQGARKWLAERWNWTEMTVRGFLDRLVGDQMISKNNSHSDGRLHGRSIGIISIENYDIYQVASDLDQLLRDGQTTTQQPLGNHLATTQQPESNKENKDTSEQELEDSSLRSESAPAAPGQAADDPPPAIEEGDLSADELPPDRIVWGACAAWMVRKTGKAERSIKSLIGKWAKVLTYPELLTAFRACRDCGADPVPYISAIVGRAEKVAMERCRRENGRLVAVNGFRQELEQILLGRDLQRSLDVINGRIPQAVVGPDLEARVRSMAIEMVDRVTDQDRRYAEAAARGGGRRGVGATNCAYDGRVPDADGFLFAKPTFGVSNRPAPLEQRWLEENRIRAERGRPAMPMPRELADADGV